ncbi:MAG: pyridoxamine 5'-phosphate oxidase family protein, partial [Acidobacteriota bacterium]
MAPIIFSPTTLETHASTKINCEDGLGNLVILLESERMLINEISEKECRDVLTNATVARLGCSLDNQPYVVPVAMTYEADYIYF